MNTIKIFAFSLISLFLTSCFQDESNYDYGKTNEINVNFGKNVFAILFNEEISFTPEIKYVNKEEKPNVSYVWMIDSKVLSTEKTFVYKAGYDVKEEHIALIITDLSNGQRHVSRVTVQVNSPLTTGIVILSEDSNGKAMLSMISTIIEPGEKDVRNDSLIYEKEIVNIYEDINNQSLGSNPVSINEHFAYDVSGNSPIYGEITVVTEGGKRVEELNGLSMKRETTISDEFLGNTLPNNFTASSIVHTCWDSFIIDKNTKLMYSRRNEDAKAYHTGYFDKELAYNKGAKYINIFDSYYVKNNTLLALEEDANGKVNFIGIRSQRTAGFPTYGGQILTPAVEEDSNDKLLEDLKDIKGDIISAAYGKYGNEDSSAKNYFVIKDGNNYILHYIDVCSYSARHSYFLVSDSKKINLPSGVLGVVTNKVANQLYFWTKSDVYTLKTSSVAELTKPAQKIYSASGRDIVGVADQTSIRDFKIERKVDPQLIFAFSDGSVEVHELQKPSFDKLTAKPVFVSKENYGKIKQIIYKIGDSRIYHNEK